MRFALAGSTVLACVYAVASASALGQAPAFAPVAAPDCAAPAGTQDLRIFRTVQSQHPFTVAGPLGGLMGTQDGRFEAWVWPMKVLSNLRIQADIQNYAVPVDVNEQAATVDVRPGCTIVTYAHAAFTVKQIMFAPRDSAPGTGVVAMFTVDSVRPMTLTFSFTPEVRRMWPAPNWGVPNAEWVAGAPGAGQGYYVLHTDTPRVTAALTIPGAEPGILAPYQEKPKVYPLQLKVHFDPARDRGRAWPLLIATENGHAADAANSTPQPVYGTRSGDAHAVADPIAQGGEKGVSSAEMGARLMALNAALPQAFDTTQQYWRRFLATHLSVSTPDAAFNDAMQWAEVSIDQSQVRWHPERNGGETGMTAGWFSSGDSARPGFGWFFGRDTLWTMFAINSEGDFSLARRAFEFILARQRADGKIMHEFSQSADEVDWNAFPYEYAAADATPLMLMAMADYVTASGDTEFLKQHWSQIQKVWQFETTHDANGDGIYDNSQGTGWVESWPAPFPQQEIYMAVLDQQASGAMARLAQAMGDANTEENATARAHKILSTVQAEYAPAGGSGGMYAFSYNSGKQDSTPTIYPTVAWWDGHYGLPDSDPMFARWASPEFSPGWGTRDVANTSPVYDPISYHQGTIWPLFTGWTAMAEYRTGHAEAGFHHLMENVSLTYAQDLGAVTELLSGDFYQPMGRSSSHQMWSSAMTLAPAVRGLFGIEVDAAAKTIHVHPQLPPQWTEAGVRHVAAGGAEADLNFQRAGGVTTITLTGAPGWQLMTKAGKTGRTVTEPAAAAASRDTPLPALPEPGSR